MDSQNCDFPGCANTAVARVHGVHNRRVAERWFYCEDHVRPFFDTYYAAQRTGSGTYGKCEQGAVFDIELVVYDERLDTPSHFSLRENGGPRRLDCGIGPFEAAALLWQLDSHQHARPLTHSAMASVITSLGGQLECVVIDRFYPAQKVAYEAKLHVRQMNTKLVVDVRPSDAVVLAVVCDVPIAVSDGVLAHLTETQQ